MPIPKTTDSSYVARIPCPKDDADTIRRHYGHGWLTQYCRACIAAVAANIRAGKPTPALEIIKALSEITKNADTRGKTGGSTQLDFDFGEPD